MTVHLGEGVADACRAACAQFELEIVKLSRSYSHGLQVSSVGSFETARQIGTVYSLFADEDLASLLNGFVDQARAMAMLFAAAGGLIEAQDEALAGALSKAAEEPAGLQSLGLIRASESDVFMLDDACVMGAYGRVGPEDVSDSPLERIAQCAQALQPEQFSEIQQRTEKVAETLHYAAAQLHSDLNNVLGHGWQGEFAASALDSVAGLVNSAFALSGELEQVSTKARRAHEGFVTTRTNIAEQAAQAKIAELSGREFGPAGLSAAAQARTEMRAAEEQARAIVNTEYSPAVMDANLDDLDFTAAYRVVSASALGGPSGIDMARVWNTDGLARPAQPAAPNPDLIATLAGGTGAENGSPGTSGAAGGVGAGTTTSQPGPAANAATEQALLAARAGAADGGAAGGGPGAAAAGQVGPGGGVNAATTSAGAPLAPMTGVNGQQVGTGAGGTGGIRGVRGGTSGGGRDRDRGFGSTAGLAGGGGAAAAGAGAARMGGAGTLAGLGAGGAAGPGVGGPVAGAPGAGVAGGGAAGPGAGALSSSSTGAAQAGRAGAMPMGGVMGAAGAGQNNDRRGHTPAGYLTNATNTSAIIGDPVKVAPAVLGRAPAEDAAATPTQSEPLPGRTLGRDYYGGGEKRP